MNAGGVLILGDHSNPVVDQSVPPVNLLWNLGRALGGSVLRAGKMRVWEGPPGADRAEGQVNTSGDNDMVSMPNQEDNVPQAIFPVFWDVHIGHSFQRHWHPLFIGPPSDGNPLGIIRIMADHGHEGALVQPAELEPPEWPTAPGGYQPKPVVVAHGTNMDTGERVPLVSAYDGHPAGVGRIVAHTTWHHFVNVNLHGFLLPDGSPDESLQILGQYFNNLVWYLMPHRQKDGTLGSALEWLTDSAIIRDLRGAPLGVLGRAAYVVLNEVASRGQIQDLLHQAVEAALPPTQDNATLQLPLPPLPYLLGGLVAERQDFHRKAGKHDYESTGTRSLVAQGIKRALRTHLEEHKANVEVVEGLLKRL
jgi:hypothetical protein